MRSCERHSGVAYIGSLNLSMKVFSQIRGSGEDIEWALRYSIERGAVSIRVGVIGPGQRDLSAQIDQVEVNCLLEQSSLPMRAKINAMSADNAGAWLHAIPSPHWGTEFPSSEVKISLKRRLGMKLCKKGPCAELHCKEWCDEWGNHSARYKGGVGCALGTEPLLMRSAKSSSKPCVRDAFLNPKHHQEAR